MIKKIIVLIVIFAPLNCMAEKTTYEGTSKDLQEALTLVKNNPQKYQMRFANAKKEELIIAANEVMDFRLKPFSKIAFVEILNENPENAECSKTIFSRKRMGGWHIKQFDTSQDEQRKKCVIL